VPPSPRRRARLPSPRIGGCRRRTDPSSSWSPPARHDHEHSARDEQAFEVPVAVGNSARTSPNAQPLSAVASRAASRFSHGTTNQHSAVKPAPTATSTA
jgi:hypothetical protein